MNLESMLALQADPNLSSAASDHRGQIGREQHQAWLKEMERAQQRQSSVVADHARRPHAVTSEQPRTVQAKASHGNAVRPSQGDAKSSPHALPEARTAAASAAPRVEAQPFRLGHAELPQAVPHLLMQKSVAPFAVRATDTSAIAGALTERMKWEPRHTLVVERDDDVHVWLRDASLEQEDDASLFAQVSRELLAMGYRLASLTVNGRKLGSTA